MKGAIEWLKRGEIIKVEFYTNGECQRSDGRYQYDYVENGKAKCVYSWKLEPTYPLPSGKRKCQSLREKIRDIQKNMVDGIVPSGGELTVLELAEKYISMRTGVWLRYIGKSILSISVRNIIRFTKYRCLK